MMAMNHGKCGNLAELCSVISGSSENSRYGDICKYPTMDGFQSHYSSSDLSPLIPVQDINMESLEIAMGDAVCQNAFLSGASLEHRSQENQTFMEDSQVDLFESDHLFGQQFQSHEEQLSPKNMLCCSKETTNSSKDSGQAAFSSKTVDNVSQPLLCEPVKAGLNNHISSHQISSSKIMGHDQFSGESLFDRKGHNAASDITSSCIIPPMTPNCEDQFLRSPKAHVINVQSSFSSKTDSLILQAETKISLDMEDAISITSVSTIQPDLVRNEDEKSMSKKIITACNIEDDPVHTVDELNSCTPNQDCDLQLPSHSKHVLICQEQNDVTKSHKRNNNVSFSSQGTKSSCDLFLSSTVPEVCPVQKASEDLLETNEAKKFSDASAMLCDDSQGKDRQIESLPSLQKSSGSRKESGSKEELFESCIGNRKFQLESASLKEKYDSINKEHEEKLKSLQRFDSLCHRIVSCLDDASGNHKDFIESCIQRCEHLITKMHAMQKEEKTKLCSSLKGVGVGKQKKKMLKKQLEHLKSRHQTLMDIVNKYGKIKNRVAMKGDESNQISEVPSRNVSKSGQIDVMEISNGKPVLVKQPMVCNDDNKVEEELVENTLNSASSIECLGNTQGTDDCGQISGNSIVPADDQIHFGWKNNGVSATQAAACTLSMSSLSDKMRNTVYQNNVEENKKEKCINDNKMKIDVIVSNSKRTSLDTSVETMKLPNKRKFVSKFSPPKKKLQASVKGLKSTHGSVIPSSEAESLVIVDNILFTEFQDPSPEIVEATIPKDSGGQQLKERAKYSSDELSTKNVSAKETVICIDDEIVCVELPNVSHTDNDVHQKLNNPNDILCIDVNETKAQTPSILNMPQTYTDNNEVKNSTPSKYSSIWNIPQSKAVSTLSVPSAATAQSNRYIDLTLVAETKENCVSSSYSQMRENASSDLTITNIEQMNLNHTATDADLILHNIELNGENSDTNFETSTQAGVRSHVRHEKQQEITKSSYSSKIANVMSKEAEFISPIDISSSSVCSTRLVKNKPPAPHNSVDCSTDVPMKIVEEKDSIPVQKSAGPPSPCSTQGSSLFPVSSREIVRRVQSRQPLPKSIPTAGNNDNQILLLNTSAIGASQAGYSSSKAPLLLSNTFSLPTKQQSELKPSVPSQLNLEPSAVSLNTIMTSSLCMPGSGNSCKDISKPKRQRKKKSKTISHFTQTSPPILTTMNDVNEKENKSRCNMHSENILHNVSTTDDCLSHSWLKEPIGTNYSSTVKPNDKNFSSTSKSQPLISHHMNEFGSQLQDSSSVYSIINGLRTVRLIGDEELIPPGNGGFPAEFWDEDFANIEISQSIWDSVVDW